MDVPTKDLYKDELTALVSRARTAERRGSPPARRRRPEPAGCLAASGDAALNTAGSRRLRRPIHHRFALS